MGVRSKFGRNQKYKELTDSTRPGVKLEKGQAAMHLPFNIGHLNATSIAVIEAVDGVIAVQVDYENGRAFAIYEPAPEPGVRKRIGLAINRAVREAGKRKFQMPEVESVEVLDEIELTVRFKDGHVIIIIQNSEWFFGPQDAIETFSLRLRAREVALYQSPYQRPRNTDSRNGFVKLEHGYDVDRTAKYWTAADAYIRLQVNTAGGFAELEAQNPTMYRAFRVISAGYNEMSDVQAGRVEVHSQPVAANSTHQ